MFIHGIESATNVCHLFNRRQHRNLPRAENFGDGIMSGKKGQEKEREEKYLSQEVEQKVFDVIWNV